MISLASQIQAFKFENCLMNASGVHCFTTKELDELRASKAGTLVTKSATKDFREGNPKPRYQSMPLGSINSMGLPNEGFQYYLDYCLQQEKSPQTPTLFFSIAGTSPDENIQMLHQIQDSSFSGLTELNLSCPNVPGKPQMGLDFEATEKILTAVFEFYKKPLGVKLPPYFDIIHFDQIAAILNHFPLAYVNTINSIGNGLIIDPATDTVVIRPKGGFGGLGGQYVKPTALANVRALRQRLNPEISIIGTGGVTTGQDVYEHILCGADMVQVGTQLAKEGPTVFERLSSELATIMVQKGYSKLDDFRGKLKIIE